MDRSGMNQTFQIVPTKISPSDWGLVSVEAMDWAHFKLPTFTKIWFRCCLTQMRKWSGAPLCLNHMWFHIHRGTSCMSSGGTFTKKLWYATSMSVHDKTDSPISQSPMIPAHTLIEDQCWFLDCRIAWGFSSAYLSVMEVGNAALCKSCFTGERNTWQCGLFAHFVRSHLLNTAVPGWAAGVRP
jgi:hypothetical protein